jgi:hypothetical protein
MPERHSHVSSTSTTLADYGDQDSRNGARPATRPEFGPAGQIVTVGVVRNGFDVLFGPACRVNLGCDCSFAVAAARAFFLAREICAARRKLTALGAGCSGLLTVVLLTVVQIVHGCSDLRSSRFAYIQSAGSQGAHSATVQDGFPRAAGFTAATRCVHARVHTDPQEAELGPA